MSEPPLLPDALALVRALVTAPGPPGQEGPVRDAVAGYVGSLGLAHRTDAKGNLLVGPGGRIPERARIIVTAHLDEIALQVTNLLPGGDLAVAPLGGAHPWKWGEGPVELLAGGAGTPAYLPGVLSFGSIHTTSPLAAAQQAREGRALTWEAARVVTGLPGAELRKAGVRPGTRAVVARARRAVWELGGGLVASYFLDDRADLAAWLLALARLCGTAGFEDVLFAATVAEEIGGHGALYLLREHRPDVCVALEIGPTTPDAPFPLDANPTVWVSDPFAPMTPEDAARVEEAGASLGLTPRFHVVTRGGSDASCAAAQGLCARPVTLAFAAENSHGFEIMHRDAPESLARLLVELLPRL